MFVQLNYVSSMYIFIFVYSFCVCQLVLCVTLGPCYLIVTLSQKEFIEFLVFLLLFVQVSFMR